MAESDPDIEQLRKQYEALKPKYQEISFENFLGTTPPDTYVYLVDLKLGADHRFIKTPDVRLYCEGNDCLGPRLFGCGSDIVINSGWRFNYLHYSCRNCGTRAYTFAIGISVQKEPSGSVDGRGTGLKLGQEPAFGPHTPARLLKLIGEDREIFLQGRRAESRGMGIGAFAYYRRVVENQKNRIIAEIAKVASVLGSTPETDALFEDATKETRFTESIDMVKAVIPQALMINGQNPLKLLHSALSKGLHDADMTDAHCLALAQSIRTILAELAERTSEALRNDKEIQTALKVLMALPSAAKTTPDGRAEAKGIASKMGGKPNST
jgi:hypothetical protein